MIPNPKKCSMKGSKLEKYKRITNIRKKAKGHKPDRAYRSLTGNLGAGEEFIRFKQGEKKMKKNLFVFAGFLLGSWLVKELARYIRHWNDYRDVYCGFALDGQPNPDVWKQVCPPIQEVNMWLYGLSIGLIFVAVIFTPMLLKHKSWVKWTCIVAAVWSFLPFGSIAYKLDDIAWSINPGWFINAEHTANTDFYWNHWSKWIDGLLFVESNLQWLVLGAVVILSLIAWDRKNKNFVARLLAKIWTITEPA